MLPNDVFYKHIIGFYPKDWIFVSKTCYLAVKDAILSDPRINVNKSVSIIDLPRGVHLNDTNLFDWACYFGYENLVIKLLSHPQIRPSESRNRALRLAIGKGHESIAMIIFKNFKTDLSGDEQIILQCAAEKGIIEIVKSILKIPEIYINHGFILAVQNAQISVVALFLSDKRCEPNFSNNYPLTVAVQYGYINITKALLDDRRVDPSDRNGWALQRSVENGNLDICKLLLADPRVKFNKDILRECISRNSIEIIKLINDKNTEFNCIENAILFALGKSNLEIVKLLLQINKDSKYKSYVELVGDIPKTEQMQKFAIYAIKRGDYSIAKSIVSDLESEK